MATFTPREFVGKLVELNGAIDHVPRVGIEDGSLIVKRTILALTPARLRGVGRRGGARAGAKLGVRYTVSDLKDGAESRIKATGPFPLIERDVREHDIPRASARKPLVAVIPNASTRDGVFSHVHHPGTRGKHPFERGSNLAIPGVRKALATANYAAVRRVF